MKALTTPGHEGKVYTLTGPESLSAAQYAAKLSSALGKPVRFVDVPLETTREAMLKNIPPAYVEAIVDLLAAMRAGKVDFVADGVRQVTGRSGGTFEAWARRNVAAFT